MRAAKTRGGPSTQGDPMQAGLTRGQSMRGGRTQACPMLGPQMQALTTPEFLMQVESMPANSMLGLLMQGAQTQALRTQGMMRGSMQACPTRVSPTLGRTMPEKMRENPTLERSKQMLASQTPVTKTQADFWTL